jgi:uncharacterized protein YigE (DUF2233 family)
MRYSNLLLFLVIIATGYLMVRVRDLTTEVSRLAQVVDRLNGDPSRSLKNGQARNGGEKVEFQGHSYDTYSVDLTKMSVKIYFKDGHGQKLETIRNLKQYLENNSSELVFATNAGMFSGDFNAIGLLIEQGKLVSPLNLKDADGNFYMKPNGVFALADKQAFVLDSSKFDELAKKVTIVNATQSGPLLLSNSNLHPNFKIESNNRAVRSGVGIVSPTKIVFAISNDSVNFFEFATLFKERFGCHDALYLDGVVSKMYLPSLKRFDLDGNFAAIIAVADKPQEVAQKR